MVGKYEVENLKLSSFVSRHGESEFLHTNKRKYPPHIPFEFWTNS